MNNSHHSISCPLLVDVPSEDLQRDCPTAKVFSFQHKDAIFVQGENVRAIFCVLSGQVTLARVSREGESFTTALLGAGDFFGPALSGIPETEDTAQAKGHVSAWKVPLEEFQNLLLNHPIISWEFIAILARRQRQIERRLEGLAFKRTEVRLAETLIELSGDFATRCEHGFGQHLRLTQQELADLVGASRPVVSTILNKLRDQGILGYSREYVCVRGIDDIKQFIDK